MDGWQWLRVVGFAQTDSGGVEDWDMSAFGFVTCQGGAVPEPLSRDNNNSRVQSQQGLCCPP